MERHRGEDAGDLKRSELDELVENGTCLNAPGRNIWKINSKILTDEKSWETLKSNQKIVMDEELFQDVMMDEELVHDAEQTTEITTELINRAFLLTATNQQRGVQNLESVLQQMHTALMARNLLRTIISPRRCSLLELQAGIERWESYVSRYEKKLNDIMDDEINLAGLEALVPEELEKHLILTSNRLRTFEDARLEIVTYVEAKFGLRILDSKPSDTSLREHSDPTDVGANSFSSGKGKGSSGPRDGCFKCGGAHFQRECNASKNTGKQSSGKGNQSKSWSTSEPSISGKGKSKENQGKSKGLSKGTKSENKGSKGAKGSCKGKTSKTGISGPENLKSETCS